MSTSLEFDEELARKQEQLAKTPEMLAQRRACLYGRPFGLQQNPCQHDSLEAFTPK